ncbi:ABC transporter permease [Actinomadura chibensis]|uniref:ABC transporter permease n=1 Tax=Actinomadura chibensis TaxID=392828 RepID=A0A5D0N6U2_9ACTN|nr:ABC transporter permease [Actinomadura chibensis]TYB40069.1 ABC transporter permease [Actinomadura chibensis]
MIDAFAAEWYKLRTVRSTGAVFGAVGAFMLLCVLYSWYVGHYWDGLSAAERARMEASPPDQLLAVTLPVCAIVLGALTLTSEYASGMHRTTLTALPRRLTLFTAKAGVAGGAMLVAALASLAAGFLGGKAVVGDRAVPTFHGPAGATAAHLLWVGLAAAALTLITYAVGAVLRSTAATITSMLGLLIVVPVLTRLLPSPWDDRAWSLLPEALPGQIAAAPGTSGGTGVLPGPVAAVLMAVYVAVALAVGAFSFVRRDA